jgi:hypothetical protein
VDVEGAKLNRTEAEPVHGELVHQAGPVN